jgi:hypothetical protein
MAGKYDHLIDGKPGAPVEPDLSKDVEWLDLAEDARAIVARFTAVATVVRETSALDPQRAERTLAHIAARTRPHLERLYELAERAERKTVAAPARPHVEKAG